MGSYIWLILFQVGHPPLSKIEAVLKKIQDNQIKGKFVSFPIFSVRKHQFLIFAHAQRFEVKMKKKKTKYHRSETKKIFFDKSDQTIVFLGQKYIEIMYWNIFFAHAQLIFIALKKSWIFNFDPKWGTN